MEHWERMDGGEGVEAEARDRKAGGKTAHAPSSSTWCITCCPLLKPPCLRRSFFLFFFFSFHCLSLSLFYPVLSFPLFLRFFPHLLRSPCSTLAVPLVLAHPSLTSSPPRSTRTLSCARSFAILLILSLLSPLVLN